MPKKEKPKQNKVEKNRNWSRKKRENDFVFCSCCVLWFSFVWYELCFLFFSEVDRLENGHGLKLFLCFWVWIVVCGVVLCCLCFSLCYDVCIVSLCVCFFWYELWYEFCFLFFWVWIVFCLFPVWLVVWIVFFSFLSCSGVPKKSFLKSISAQKNNIPLEKMKFRTLDRRPSDERPGQSLTPFPLCNLLPRGCLRSESSCPAQVSEKK